MIQLRLPNRIRLAVFLGVAVLLIGVETAITRSSAFERYPVGTSVGVLFDLVFVTTALFYWLVARPFHLPVNRVWLVALIMVRIALFILPETALLPAQLWPLLLGAIEGIVLVIAGVRIRTIVRAYRKLRPTTDAETALRLSLAQIFGERIASLIIGEGQIMYYVLMGWRFRIDVPEKANIVTAHRQSGQIALTVTLISIGLVEGVVVHILVTRWSPAVAFWLTCGSGYCLLFFVADMLATVKRPSYYTDSHLHIRLGIRWRAVIPYDAIRNVTVIHEKPAKQATSLTGSFLTAPNVLLTFTKPITFQGPYGIQRDVQSFSFFVDDREYFRQQLIERKVDNSHR